MSRKWVRLTGVMGTAGVLSLLAGTGSHRRRGEEQRRSREAAAGTRASNVTSWAGSHDWWDPSHGGTDWW
jgi:hypothetical protein